MSKIGIIGCGVVGSALKFGFEKLGHNCSVYDIKYKNTTIEDVIDTEVVFICVPTNMLDDGSCDTSIVEAVVGKLNVLEYSGIVTIKSTVVPGTTDTLQNKYPFLEIAFCPEFLRERSAISDFCENHDVLIVGTRKKIVFENIVKIHGDLPKQKFMFKPIEAELAKYYHNIFNMLRIVFANEFFDVCECLGADYTKIKNAVCFHRLSTNKYYLDCSENWRGAGGVCLPKDTIAFAKFVEKIFENKDNFFKYLYDENKKFKTTIFDGMRIE